MTSILEKHEEFIIQKISKGDSYSVIAKALKDMGCKTSTQNLFTWIKRRPAKLKARQALAHALRPQSETKHEPTALTVNEPQTFATESEKSWKNQNPESTSQTNDRSTENDFLKNLINKCPTSLLPIIFNKNNL